MGSEVQKTLDFREGRSVSLVHRVCVGFHLDLRRTSQNIPEIWDQSLNDLSMVRQQGARGASCAPLIILMELPESQLHISLRLKELCVTLLPGRSLWNSRSTQTVAALDASRVLARHDLGALA